MQSKSQNNVKIIDVSHHQNDRGAIDWKAVKASGVSGTFIKASEGGSVKDPDFFTNATGALTAGLATGYYHYAHPELNNALTEAANFVRAVKGIRADFPYALDVEGMASKIGPDALTAWCVTWLQEVERLTGHAVMIYSGGSFAKTYLGKALAKWSLWIAHYGVTKPMANNTWEEWSVFQYSSSASVDGITGNVDMNAMEKLFFDKYAGVSNMPQPTEEDKIKIVVNDRLVAYGRMIDGHVYLPIRQLGEALGIPVDWKNSSPYIDGKVITSFQLLSGKTYVGVRGAAEIIGGSVSWDGDTQKVYLYK